MSIQLVFTDFLNFFMIIFSSALNFSFSGVVLCTKDMGILRCVV